MVRVLILVLDHTRALSKVGQKPIPRDMCPGQCPRKDWKSLERMDTAFVEHMK